MQNLKKNKIHKYIDDLDSFVLSNKEAIDVWLLGKELKDTPLYSSIDIRNSGFKISPIDTNLFPSGFNNISKQGLQKATQYFSQYFSKFFPSAKKIALISEQFTRNVSYYENIKFLFKALQDTNLDIRILTIAEEPIEIEGLEIFQFKKQNSVVVAHDDWSPDLIILNNDLTEKIPEKLIDLSTPILPNLKYGWHNRRKCFHYEAYNDLVRLFCAEFKIDPWLISTYYSKCTDVNFKKKEGLECIAQKIDNLLIEIQKKYDEYQIQQEPVVFIKPNNGTFGRGIMSVKTGGEIINLNKKLRHSLNTIKDNVINSEVIIQEGIPTIEKVENYPAESIIYLVGAKVIGKFMRYNTVKGIDNNLNSKGMLFTQNSEISPSELLLSKLATIAVAYETIE
jgi:glutamate--cysteine ligase